MNTKKLSITCLSLGLAITAQFGHTAAIQSKTSPSPERPSLITKALNQQKMEDHSAHSNSDLKIITAIKTAPTQSFFAAQNQSFTRFVQSIFSNNS